MAIEYFYLYSPFGGTQGGQGYYCNTVLHKLAYPGVYCCPTDLRTGGNTAIKFRCSSNVQSIRTVQINDICSPANDPPGGYTWVDRGVEVQMYCRKGGNGTLIGKVLYGHVNDTRISNNVYDYPNGLTLGYMGPNDCTCPSSTCGSCGHAGCGCENGVTSCICKCYSGLHVHLEVTAANGAYRIPRSCGTTILTSTQIYRWQMDSIYCQIY